MLKKKSTGLLTATLFFAACTGGGGGGGGSKSSVASSISGVLVDSAIQGVYYESGSLSGLTDSSGKFQCRPGEKVEFSLAGSNGKHIYLGEILCRKVISPIEIVTEGEFTIENDLSDLSAGQQAAVKNVLRLMQSFDSRSDVDGIQIDADEVADLADHLESQSVDIENDGMDGLLSLNEADMTTYLTGIMTVMGRPGDVVSEADAVAHFEETQTVCSDSGCAAEDDDETETPAPAPAIAMCLTGKTFATIEVLGDGYVGGRNLPINHLNGDLYTLGPSAYPGEQFETLFVLYQNGSAKMFRSRVPGGAYYYEFKTSGWSNPLIFDADNDGVAENGDVRELSITGVQFEFETRTMNFEPYTIGFHTDTYSGWPNDFGNDTALGGVIEKRDLLATSTCTVPTATEVVEGVGP